MVEIKTQLLTAYNKLARGAARFGARRLGFLRPIDNRIRGRLEEGTVVVQGQKMFLDPVDTLHLAEWGIHEPFETHVIVQEIREGDVVVDIGANIGYYTLLLARLVGPRGKVFAFEPDPANFELLTKNVRINGYRNVILVDKAVSDRTGTAKLFLSEENMGDHRLYDSMDDRRWVEVDTIALDDYFEAYEGRLDFVKMDVQGTEPAAVRGMRGLLERWPGLRMLSELWPYGLTRFGVEAADYLEELRGLGFHLFHVNDDAERVEPLHVEKVLARFPPGNDEHTNVLCARVEHYEPRNPVSAR